MAQPIPDDDLLEGFDLPAGLDDLPDLPVTPAEELAQMLGGDGTDLDGRMEVARPWFDPDEPVLLKFAVTGDTYPIKDALKTLGCRWNGKAWIAPDEATYKQACAARDAYGKQKHQPRQCLRQQQLAVRGPVTPPLGYAKAAPLGYAKVAPLPPPAKPRPAPNVDVLIAGMDEAMGAWRKGEPREAFDPNVEVDEQRDRSARGQIRGALKRAVDEELADELRRRGYVIVKKSERNLVVEAFAREGLSLEDADAAFEEQS